MVLSKCLVGNLCNFQIFQKYIDHYLQIFFEKYNALCHGPNGYTNHSTLCLKQTKLSPQHHFHIRVLVFTYKNIIAKPANFEFELEIFFYDKTDTRADL